MVLTGHSVWSTGTVNHIWKALAPWCVRATNNKKEWIDCKNGPHETCPSITLTGKATLPTDQVDIDIYLGLHSSVMQATISPERGEGAGGWLLPCHRLQSCHILSADWELYRPFTSRTRRVCNGRPKTTAEQPLSGSQKRIRRSRIQDEQPAQGSSGPVKALLLSIRCTPILWLTGWTVTIRSTATTDCILPKHTFGSWIQWQTATKIMPFTEWIRLKAWNGTADKNLKSAGFFQMPIPDYLMHHGTQNSESS